MVILVGERMNNFITFATICFILLNFGSCIDAFTPIDPCARSQCGGNAVCEERNGTGLCVCLPDHFGDPYQGCRPECVINSDCALDRACINQKCKDPCTGICASYAECKVIERVPSCSCLPSYTGDPKKVCYPIGEKHPTTEKSSQNSCDPSPCGPYSKCKIKNNVPACSCLANYTGRPPNCRDKCVTNAECPSNLACINEKCVDPCPGSCGNSAKCNVINHISICFCPAGYTGDAFVKCRPESNAQNFSVEAFNPCLPNPCKKNSECINEDEEAVCQCIPGYFGDPYRKDCEAIPPNENPCDPSPCGPNSRCRVLTQPALQPVCSCESPFIGSPPNCRPECVVNSDCAPDRACINSRCADPCKNACGSYALCNVSKHIVYCSCPPHWSGNPFSKCVPILDETPGTTN